MVLSAIIKKGKVITPYKMVDSNNVVEAHEAYRMIQKLIESGTALFCLDCYCECGEYRPVGLRKTDVTQRRPHFVHPPSSACQSRPASVESQNHRYGKEFIAKYLEDNGATAVMVERRMRSGDTCRQPDVMAVYPDRVEAHEIQLSRIDSVQLRARSKDLQSLMAQQYPRLMPVVRWYLGSKNQSDDNWLVFRRAHWWGYSINFAQDGIPSWKLASPEIIAKLDADAEGKRRANKQFAQDRFMRLKLILSRVILSRFNFALLFSLLDQLTKDELVHDALRKVRVGSKADLGGSVHVVTAVSTLWGKAALRPYKNQSPDFSVDVVWAPVENVVKNLVNV